MNLGQVAETAQAVGANTTLLSTILSGTLLAAVVAGYRFVVNFRKTERGMARQRIREANAGERAAQREASLWQQRCGDLEYLLSQRGGKVPPLSPELAKLVLTVETAADPQEEAQLENPTGSAEV